MISVSDMRKLEASAAAIGIDEALMMENAGANAASLLDSVIELQWKSVIVFCGTGNNCGDGLVFARHALISGATVTIYTVRRPEDLAPLPKKHYGVLLGLSSKGLPVSFVRRVQDAGEADILVDAMLGTGIRGEVSTEYKDAIKKFNAMGGTKVALDCPSGLDADTGKSMGACVKPDITITFHDAKAGLTRENSGRILVAGIGVPPLMK